MKTGEEHWAPLTDEMLAAIEPLRPMQSEMLGRDLRNGELPYYEDVCPFDIDRKNIHENESSFAAEMSFMKNWLAQFDGMSGVLQRDTSTKSDQDHMRDLVEYLND